MAFGYLATLAEVFDSPQHEAREFFKPTAAHPEVGTLTTCNAPFHSSQAGWRTGRAPLLGEHNTEIYGDRLGYTAEAIAQLQQEGVI
ncbi:MAG: hypothetical protein HC800_08000 [Phormidesmis sp. RL_2_1]|nr:hypothetical protein [Phormidesmis sp. RL_2_1]